jgi:hypothetical protein
MAAIDDLLAHYRKLHSEMINDINHWRSNKWRLHKDHEDITDWWLSEQQRRADCLAAIIAAHETRT